MLQICFLDFNLAQFLSVYNVMSFLLFLQVASSVLSFLLLWGYLIMVCISEVFFIVIDFSDLRTSFHL